MGRGNDLAFLVGRGHRPFVRCSLPWVNAAGETRKGGSGRHGSQKGQGRAGRSDGDPVQLLPPSAFPEQSGRHSSPLLERDTGWREARGST